MNIRLVAAAAVLLMRCEEPSLPVHHPALPQAEIVFEPDVAKAWDEARITPPVVAHRPAMKFGSAYPSGHLPVEKGTKVTFILAVASDGSVESVTVPDWNGLESGRLRGDLVANLSSWRFDPAIDEGGNAVASETKITVSFNL
ncbi:MAG TPA: hypothetical protein VF701_18065 [Thermoanaerobaculia bacterium]